MKISFENKMLNCYKDIYHQIKYVQETCENVVPDVNDDIGKIASVQSTVHLKSKDLTGRGVLISGEAIASVIYVTESEKNVSFVRLSKRFSLEYEIPGMSSDVLAQIRLDIQNTEARIINPRKLSVTFEICGELNCFREGHIPIKTVQTEKVPCKIHTRLNKTKVMYTNAVCEKTFTLSEQLIFPSGKPSPSQIAMLKTSFELNDSQNVGSKLIVKGNLNFCLCYLSEEVNYPVKAEFSTPFSQIIDLAVDKLDSYNALVEISSVYYDVINTISGEKALDTEVHAVLQISARQSKEIEYISDVYSNIMPSHCGLSSQSLTSYSALQQTKLIADERLSVVDDCNDVLSVFTNVSLLKLQGEKINATVNLDIIYRTKNGTLSAARRSINLSGDCQSNPERLVSALLTDIYLRPDGASIDVHAAVDIKYICSKKAEIMFVADVELDEENAYDFSSFPAIYLVKAETEDLWTLAKNYHSSIEKISASNVLEDGICGKLLLIPKSV